MVAWSSFYLVVEKEVAYMKGKSFGKKKKLKFVHSAMNILMLFISDCYRIVHVALNEYIHHVIELLQLKVIEAQFSASLVPSTCKLQVIAP